MQYSPKLKKAMQEIKDILSKHDIAGVVIIHTPGFVEHMSKINPTYSCCKINGDMIRVRARVADFDGDKEAWKKSTGETADMLHGLAITTSVVLLPLIDMSEGLDKALGIKRDPGQSSSHVTQNN